LGVVGDEGAGGLFGVMKKFSVRAQPMRSGWRRSKEFGLVGQFGAGGVAEGIAAALVAAGEEVAGGGAVIEGDAQFLADAFVPEFGEGFGELDAGCRACRGIRCSRLFRGGRFRRGHVGADGDAGEGDGVELGNW